MKTDLLTIFYVVFMIRKLIVEKELYIWLKFIVFFMKSADFQVVTSFIIPWIFAEPTESAIDPKKQRRNDHRREKIVYQRR